MFFFFMSLPPPRSSLFPYTTLFRSPSLTLRDGELKSCYAILKVYGMAAFFAKAVCNLCSNSGVSVRKTDRKITHLNSTHHTISYPASPFNKPIPLHIPYSLVHLHIT